MEQEKTCVSKRKNEENKLKKLKENRRWKTEVFFWVKKNKGEDKPEERNKKRKGEGRREVCKKRTKGGCSKRKRKNIHSFPRK